MSCRLHMGLAGAALAFTCSQATTAVLLTTYTVVRDARMAAKAHEEATWCKPSMAMFAGRHSALNVRRCKRQEWDLKQLGRRSNCGVCRAARRRSGVKQHSHSGSVPASRWSLPGLLLLRPALVLVRCITVRLAYWGSLLTTRWMRIAVSTGWGAYLSYGLPATIQLCTEWWMYEVVIFMAGGYLHLLTAVLMQGWDACTQGTLHVSRNNRQACCWF